MRDINRIDLIIEEVRKYWLENPDQRLGQLLSNIVMSSGWHTRDIYNAEDDRIVVGISNIRRLEG